MSSLGPVLTIPNVLSLIRLAGIPLFLWLVLGPEADGWALAVLMLSGVTDFLDGYLARRLNQFSALGEILDPVADRLYILAVVFGLAMRDVIPWWVAVLLPARDLFLWGLVPFLRTRGYSALPVHFLGKAATFNLLYAFPLLLLGDGDGLLARLATVWGWAFAIWGIGLYWWAGVLYAVQVYRLLNEAVVPLDWDGTITAEIPVMRPPDSDSAAEPPDVVDPAPEPPVAEPDPTPSTPPTPASTPAPRAESPRPEVAASAAAQPEVGPISDQALTAADPEPAPAPPVTTGRRARRIAEGETVPKPAEPYTPRRRAEPQGE